MTFLTNLKLEPKGVHSAAQAYNVSDVVTSADGSVAYAAVKDVPAGIALSNAEYWVKVLDLAGVRAAAVSAAESANAAAESANAAAESAETKASNSLKYIVHDLTDPFNASGNPVQCNPVGGLVFDGLETQFFPKQAGEGDPSPQNIRSIGGWDTLGLTRSGKNLFKNTVATTTTNGVTITINKDDSTVTLDGTATANTSWNLGFFTPAVDMNIILNGSIGGSTSSFMLRLYNESGTSNLLIAANGDSDVYRVEGGKTYRVYAFIISGTVCSGIKMYPMIRLSSVSDDTYEPYQFDTYTVQIGQTVYGGHMNWLTGELTAQWACDALDGTETISANPGDLNTAYRYSATLSNKAVEGYGYADRYLLQSWATKDYTFYPYTHGIMVVHPGLTNVEDFKAYLASQFAAGTPVQIAYKLATPTTIQLTPHQIAALQGVNTLYGDGDTITAAGRQSKTIALESRIEALEAAILNA